MNKSMKNALLIGLLMANLGGLGGQNVPAKTTYPPIKTVTPRGSILKGIQIPPLKFNKPSIQESRLDRGVRMWKVEDSSLPMVSVEFFFDGGLNAESLESAGVLSAMLSLMENGGAGKLTSDETARKLALLGAKISFDVAYEHWSIRLTVLKSHFDESFKIFSDILLNPEMPEQRLKIIQSKMMSDVKRRNNRPPSVANRKMIELLYGGFRRGYSLQPSDIKKINTKQLKTELQRRLQKSKIIVTASGDIKGMYLDTYVKRLLAGFPKPQGDTELKKEKLSFKTLNKLSHKSKGKILLVEFPQAVQASILTAGYLPRHNHPDFYALQVGNYILGGGSFNSRLMKEIRVKRGLAYYAYSYNAFFGQEGRFAASTATRAPKTDQTLKLLLSTVQNLKRGVSTAELGLARSAILNSLIFEFENPAAYLKSEVRYFWHKMPRGYPSTLPASIRKVNSRQVTKVTRRYLNSDQLFIIVVGPAGLKKSLEKIRPVILINPETDMKGY